MVGKTSEDGHTGGISWEGQLSREGYKWGSAGGTVGIGVLFE